MTRTTTMEQDWNDGFSFLQTKESTEAPFLLILQHARSVRHLEEMLGEWLPPHWQLPREELAKMVEHWKKWYLPHYKSDHLVRSHVDRLCRDLEKTSADGLRRLYVRKLEEQLPDTEALAGGSIYWLSLEKEVKQVLLHGRTLKRAGKFGTTMSKDIWFFKFLVEKTELTEVLTYALLNLPGVIHFDSGRDHLEFYIGLEHTQHLYNHPGFLPEVRRQFAEKNVPIILIPEGEQA